MKLKKCYVIFESSVYLGKFRHICGSRIEFELASIGASRPSDYFFHTFDLSQKNIRDGLKIIDRNEHTDYLMRLGVDLSKIDPDYIIQSNNLCRK